MIKAFENISFGSDDNKSKPDFRKLIFEMKSALDILSFSGKDHERLAATVIGQMVETIEKFEESEIETFLAESTNNENFRKPNLILYSLLPRICFGRPLDIVRSFESTRSGVHALAKLRTRFREETHSRYIDLFSFNWKGSSPIEDKFRAFTQVTGRLGTTLPDTAMEALVIQGFKVAGAVALENHLRLHAPQPWSKLCECVEKYVSTL